MEDSPPNDLTPTSTPDEQASQPDPIADQRRRRRQRNRQGKRHSHSSGGPEVDADDSNGNFGEIENSTPSWTALCAAVIVIIVLLFAGGTSNLGRAIAGITVGVFMIVAPIQRRLPLLTIICLMAMLTVPLIGLLPAEWLGPLPAWRSALVENWSIELPSTISPQSRCTLESWLILVIGLGWLWSCLSRNYSAADRRGMLRVIAVGGVVICSLTLAQRFNFITIPIWPNSGANQSSVFGPFPNRNIISSLAALIAVLCAASAYDSYRQRLRTWFLFGIAIIVPSAIIVSNTSRGGMILLVLGLVGWLSTASMRRGFFKKVALSSSVILAVATVLLSYSGTLSERMRKEKSTLGFADNNRIEVYQHTFALIASNPWLGVGLGNFPEVFTVVNAEDQPYVQTTHPESDWWWLVAEGGLLLGIPFALVLFWLGTSTGPWTGGPEDSRRRRQDRRLRNAAGLCLFLGIAHGVVDIPNHNLGYGLLSCLFAGIAVRPRALSTPAGPILRTTCRIAGLAILVTGIGWAEMAMDRPVIPGKTSAVMLQGNAKTLANSSRELEALKVASDAIKEAPLLGMNYFLRAQILLRLGHPSAEAMADFAKARALYPHYVYICMDEAEAWLRHDPSMAVIPWRQALVRAPQIPTTEWGIYDQMLNAAAPYPALEAELWSLATTPGLKLIYLLHASAGPQWEKALSALLLQQPKLDGLEPIERSRLFQAWRQRGDRDQLLAALEQNSVWKQDAWQLLAAEYASRSRFKEAWAVIAKFAVRPQLPTVSPTVDVEALERTALFNPTDPVRQIDLFFAQRATQRYVEARRTLEKTLGMPNAPEYLKLELADLYALQDDYRRAWEIAREYLKLP